MNFSVLYPGKMLLPVEALRPTQRSRMNSMQEFDRWCSPVSMAVLSFFFHCSATSFARGSSGLGALNNAWIDSNTVRICRAGDHLSGRQELGRKKKKAGETNQHSGQICQTKVTSAQYSTRHHAAERWQPKRCRAAIKSVEHCSSDSCGAKRLIHGEDLLIT